jgi:hypothetical protein
VLVVPARAAYADRASASFRHSSAGSRTAWRSTVCQQSQAAPTESRSRSKIGMIQNPFQAGRSQTEHSSQKFTF